MFLICFLHVLFGVHFLTLGAPSAARVFDMFCQWHCQKNGKNVLHAFLNTRFKKGLFRDYKKGFIHFYKFFVPPTLDPPPSLTRM